jgi:hypothetical protein
MPFCHIGHRVCRSIGAGYVYAAYLRVSVLSPVISPQSLSTSAPNKVGEGRGVAQSDVLEEWSARFLTGALLFNPVHPVQPQSNNSPRTPRPHHNRITMSSAGTDTRTCSARGNLPFCLEADTSYLHPENLRLNGTWPDGGTLMGMWDCKTSARQINHFAWDSQGLDKPYPVQHGWS